MELVFNEWFLDWHLPNAPAEEKRKVRRIFKWLLLDKDHSLVILSESPFTKKLNDFRKAHSAGFTGSALKEFISGVLLAKGKCRLLETPPDLPSDVLKKLSIGNFASDLYLFQSAEATEEKIIVTTDTKLMKHFEGNGRYQLWSVEEFIAKFNVKQYLSAVKLRTSFTSQKRGCLPMNNKKTALHLTQHELDEVALRNLELEKAAKERIVEDWLPRYTGMPLAQFGEYILLVNFGGYVRTFAERNNAQLYGADRPMQAATADNITIINFGIGSPNAGLIVDLLEAIHPKAVLFLGKCGGLKTGKNHIGDLILPIAAVRGEGTSDDYLPPEVPALPAFALQKAISTTIRDYERDYWTGVVYTTNKRVWEHREDFKQRLRDLRCIAVDMETATIFVAAFKNRMPAGALLLVSDMPMTHEGIKTEVSDRQVTANFADLHLNIGVDSLKQLINKGLTVKHLRFEV